MPVKKKPKSAKAKTPAKARPIDSSAEFEALLKQAAPNGGHYVLRLFITGNTVRSSHAIANIRSLCDEYLAGRYQLEVVDIYQQPNEAAKEQIIAAPTLVKELPAPVKRLIGDLTDRDKVLVGLDLEKAGHAGAKAAKTRWVKL